MGNGKAFVWTAAKRQVLAWCEEWGVSQREMAARLGVTRRTVEGWVRRPTFQAALEARYAEIHAENEAFWARERAKTEQLRRENERRMQQLRETAQEDARVWIAWRMACHQAREAHRKLPPEPPGMF